MGFRLETERCILRGFELRDLPHFIAYRNDPEVARYQSWHLPYEEEAGRRFIADLQDDTPSHAGKWYQIAIEAKAAGHLIGDCGVGRSQDGRQAEIGYTLMPTFQGKGLMTEAVSAILTYYFDTFHLHRVSASCDIDNLTSQKLLTRLGFRQEGTFVDRFYDERCEEWRSEYGYAILRSEWFSTKK